MKLYLKIILHFMLLFILLIPVKFYIALKYIYDLHLMWYLEHLSIYALGFLMTILFIIHISISLNKIDKVKEDLIILRFKFLDKRHLGLRRIVGLILNLIIWSGIGFYIYLAIDNFEVISYFFSNFTLHGIRLSYVEWFEENLEYMEFIYPLILAGAYVFLFLFEVFNKLYFWLIDGFRKK